LIIIRLALCCTLKKAALMKAGMPKEVTKEKTTERTALQVLEIFKRGGMTQREVKEFLGVSRNGAWKTLDIMRTVGVARLDNGVWTVIQESK
jgi:hypothetical protein